jgi:hypothetical protein
LGGLVGVALRLERSVSFGEIGVYDVALELRAVDTANETGGLEVF